MQDEPYRLELGAFLRVRREQISPDSVGLSVRPGQRRRTPGLRREEMADLIGISPAWYTRLEQGQAIQASVATLESITRVLSLTQAERQYLFALAGVLPAFVPPSVDERINLALQRVLDQQGIHPAYVMNRRWDVVLWNRAAAALFLDWERVSGLERNLPYFMFTTPQLRQLIVDWERHARRIVAEFRTDYGQHSGDPVFGEVISCLNQRCPEFRRWWLDHDIGSKGPVRKEIAHPTLGRILLEQTTYALVDAPDLRLVLYVPLDDDTQCKLRELTNSH